MKRPATIASYTQAYARFERWTSEFKELNAFPTTDYAVGLYIMTLVQQGKSVSSIRQFLASVAWLHKLGSFEDPTKTTVVSAISESAYKQSARPVAHKKPVTKQVLQDIHDTLFNKNDKHILSDIRDFVYILLSFSGFLRFNEASNVRRNDLHLFFNYM